MTWVKLDEDFATHPKVVEAGPLGIALQVAALCYCNRHLTDGRIPRAAARSLLDFEGVAFVDGTRGDDVEPDDVIGRLITVGLWHVSGHDCPDCPPIERGYIIHDYLDLQPSREAVLAKREQTAEAGRKGGQARSKRDAKRDAKRNAGETPSEPEADRQAKVQAKSKPVSGPVSVPLEDPTEETFDRLWDTYPRRDGMKGGGASKKKARQLFGRVPKRDYPAVIRGAEHYAAYVVQPGAPIVAQLTTWLSQDRWEQFQEPREVDGRAPPQNGSRLSDRTEQLPAEVGSDAWEADRREAAARFRTLTGGQE